MKKALFRNRQTWPWTLFGLLIFLCVFGSVRLFERAVLRNHLNHALITAVTSDQPENVQALLREGANPNARQLPDETPPTLWEDIKANVLRLWHRQPAVPPDIPPTALLLAVETQQNGNGQADAQIVQLLLDKGANPNLISVSYPSGIAMPQTPLALAVENDLPKITQLLLDKGANAHFHSTDGEMLINKAIERDGPGTPVIVGLLLTHGADVNAQNTSGETPLTAAVTCRNNAALVKVLLAHGANLSLRDKDGETAFLQSVSTHQLGESETVALLLLAAGANVNDEDKYGNTALSRSEEDTQTFRLLLAHGAKIFTADDPQGGELITGACGSFEQFEGTYSIFDTLLSHGVNINARDKDGMTALLAAADVDVYEANVNVSPSDPDYMGPPDVPNLINYLLRHGADTKARDKWGRTALMIASEADDPKADLLLMAHGAEVNARDKYGRTALMWAVAKGKTTTARVLLSHGADVSARDAKGRTALDRARSGQFDSNSPFTSLSLMRTLMRLLQEYAARA